jgi:hypothetical protein
MSDDNKQVLALFDAEIVSPASQRQRGGNEEEPVAYFAGGSGKLADILEANEKAAIGQIGGRRRKSKRRHRKRKSSRRLKTYRRRR